MVKIMLRSTYLPTNLPPYLPTYLPTYLTTYLPTYLPIDWNILVFCSTVIPSNCLSYLRLQTRENMVYIIHLTL